MDFADYLDSLCKDYFLPMASERPCDGVVSQWHRSVPAMVSSPNGIEASLRWRLLPMTSKHPAKGANFSDYIDVFRIQLLTQSHIENMAQLVPSEDMDNRPPRHHPAK
ncbi:unnamed protein product [Larinioides sclopetarius]|uniref:Uncharacterized protein n=1 Tax=Larinioides sclopetarius TaxID=280406 RepID=A0AAV1YWD6_9ARAC